MAAVLHNMMDCKINKPNIDGIYETSFNSFRVDLSKYQDEFGKYYGALFERVPREHVTPTGQTGARYFDEAFDRDASDIEVFIGIREAEKADAVITPQSCAMTVHHGGYSTLSEAYGAVVNWIIENGYEIVGPAFDLYVKTRFDAPSPEDWVTEVYFPVRKK